jgi:hypothetical protein
MDQTDDRGYPFPQCDPPYVKDPADLPAQLKLLAEAVDDDVTALAAIAADALNPPGGLIASTTAQSPAAGAAFDYTTTVFATPGVADLAGNALVCTSAGLYVITGTCASGSSNNPSAHHLIVLVNNVQVRSDAIRNGVAAAEQIHHTTSVFIILNVGDRVTMIQSNSATITYQFVRLGMVRVVAL